MGMDYGSRLLNSRVRTIPEGGGYGADMIVTDRSTGKRIGAPMAYNRRNRRSARRTRWGSSARGGGGYRRSYKRKYARRNRRTGGFVGIEKKFIDSGLSVTALLAPATSSWAGCELAPNIQSFNAIDQGVGESQRVGRIAHIKSVYITGTFIQPKKVNQTVMDLTPTVFLCMVLDKQCNGALPNSEEVYTNPVGTAACATSLLRDLQHTNRFTILEQLRVRMPQPTVAFDNTNIEQGGNEIPFTMSHTFPGKGLKVQYKGTDADIASISNVNVTLMGSCSSLDTGVLITYNSRTRYTDA